MAEFQADPRFPSETQRTAERQAEIELYLRQLRSKSPRERSLAAKRLGDLRAEPAALLAALCDPNPFVRSAAAFALGYTVEPGDEIGAEVAEQLLGAIDDPNNHVCAAAVHSLGVMRAECAFEQILDCLEDENSFVVQAAILSAARIREKRPADSGSGGPACPPIETEPAAAERLGERLASFLDSSEYPVVLAATRAMYLLEYHPASERLMENLGQIIRGRDSQASLGQKDFKLPKAIIETLAKLECREAISLLIEIARKDVGLRGAAVEALIGLQADAAAPLLAPMLRDPSEGLRRHLVELMVAADFRSVLPMIRAMLQDPSAQIRDAALVAVSTWKDSAAVDTVRRMAYADPNPFVRPRAVSALGSLAESDAVVDLQALAHDSNGFVRQAAVEALQRSGTTPLAEDPREETTCTLLPETVDAPALLHQLETWQTGLPSIPNVCALEEIAAVDAALTRLIGWLKKNERS